MPIYKMDGKKDGQQRYRVRINYVDNAGNNKQIERVTYGNAQAKDLERELLHDLKENKSHSNLTVQQLYDEYIKSKALEVRETTLNKAVKSINLHILPYFSDKKLNKLNNTMLQNWKSEISNLGLAVKTRQNIFGEFRSMLNYAVKMEYIAKNPLLNVGNFRDAYEVSNSKDKIQYYTVEEFKRYIEQAKLNAKSSGIWDFYVFFNIAFFTGMRKGEINALKWSDIEDNILHVHRSIAQKLKGADRETPPKNKSSYRSLQIPIPLMNILIEHKKRQSMLAGYTDDYRVCGGVKCLRDTTISNKNISFAKNADIRSIRIHDFRHSHATLLANEGINIQEIARRLGHSKIEITWNTYSHLYPREEERAIEILNKIV